MINVRLKYDKITVKSDNDNMSGSTEVVQTKADKDRILLVKQINTTLKDDLKIRVRIGIDRNSIYLQYNDGTKQKKISPPSVSLSTKGIHRAGDLAKVIDNALRSGLYSDSWLKRVIYGIEPDKPKDIAVGTIKTEFGEKWLNSRKADKNSSDRQKNSTLTNYLMVLNNAIKISKAKNKDVFNEETIYLLLNAYEHGNMRHRLVTVIKLIVKLFKLQVNVEYDNRKVKTVKKRIIKTDEEIVKTFESLSEISQTSKRMIDSSLYYQWCYGMIATYGLRAHELQAIDWTLSFKPETDNWLFIRGEKIEGTKTGDREIVPLLPEWVELFDLANMPVNTSKSKSLKALTSLIDGFFKRRKIGEPYDLRHAYGIRSKGFMTVVDAAYCMGHSVEVHTRIYHSHESFDSKLASVRESMKQRWR